MALSKGRVNAAVRVMASRYGRVHGCVPVCVRNPSHFVFMAVSWCPSIFIHKYVEEEIVYG
jgi:hypothetical protein